MEDKRKHKDMRLVTNETKYKELVMKPNFKDGRKFSENLMGRGNGKVQDQDDKACVPWTSHPGSEQDDNVRVPLRLHAAEVWR